MRSSPRRSAGPLAVGHSAIAKLRPARNRRDSSIGFPADIPSLLVDDGSRLGEMTTVAHYLPDFGQADYYRVRSTP
jgi:hypothetical protein